MNENIDLTKILEGCPDETVFYSPLCGEVNGIEVREQHIIACAPELYKGVYFTSEGRLSCYDALAEKFYDSTSGECLIFPSKKQRDWSKFKRFWDKPKVEKFDINTLQPFDKVLVRNTPTVLWKADFFAFSKYPEQDMAKCVGGYWFNCIPYNDDTKHLIGTNDDCPEYYKWWKTKYDEF